MIKISSVQKLLWTPNRLLFLRNISDVTFKEHKVWSIQIGSFEFRIVRKLVPETIRESSLKEFVSRRSDPIERNFPYKSKIASFKIDRSIFKDIEVDFFRGGTSRDSDLEKDDKSEKILRPEPKKVVDKDASLKPIVASDKKDETSAVDLATVKIDAKHDDSTTPGEIKKLKVKDDDKDKTKTKVSEDQSSAKPEVKKSEKDDVKSKKDKSKDVTKKVKNKQEEKVDGKYGKRGEHCRKRTKKTNYCDQTLSKTESPTTTQLEQKIPEKIEKDASKITTPSDVHKKIEKAIKSEPEPVTKKAQKPKKDSEKSTADKEKSPEKKLNLEKDDFVKSSKDKVEKSTDKQTDGKSDDKVEKVSSDKDKGLKKDKLDKSSKDKVEKSTDKQNDARKSDEKVEKLSSDKDEGLKKDTLDKSSKDKITEKQLVKEKEPSKKDVKKEIKTEKLVKDDSIEEEHKEPPKRKKSKLDILGEKELDAPPSYVSAKKRSEMTKKSTNDKISPREHITTIYDQDVLSEVPKQLAGSDSSCESGDDVSTESCTSSDEEGGKKQKVSSGLLSDECSDDETGNLKRKADNSDCDSSSSDGGNDNCDEYQTPKTLQELCSDEESPSDASLKYAKYINGLNNTIFSNVKAATPESKITSGNEITNNVKHYGCRNKRRKISSAVKKQAEIETSTMEYCKFVEMELLKEIETERYRSENDHPQAPRNKRWKW